jgi:hypothetical protein
VAKKKKPLPVKSPILTAVETALATQAQSVAAVVITELAKTAQGNAPVLAFLSAAYKQLRGPVAFDDPPPILEGGGGSDLNGHTEQSTGSYSRNQPLQ